tara:strand:+ start:862 stop:1086 length:225 start_codon:yes stop_codon:yes gene_type:complete
MTNNWQTTSILLEIFIPLRPWVSLWRGQQLSIEDKPQLERWLVAVKSRDTVQRERSIASARHENLPTDQNPKSF